MFDITSSISCIIRIAILEIPVFYAALLIWKNFVGVLRFILILVLSLLAYGLFSGLGMLLPKVKTIYLSTHLNQVTLLAYTVFFIAIICMIVLIPLSIYLYFKTAEYEDEDADDEE